MNALNKISLKYKVIAIVLIVCVLNFAGGILALSSFGKSYEKETYSKMVHWADTLSEKIAAQFFERYGDVQAFALNPYVQALNSKKLPAYLDEYVRTYGLYDVILVVDKDGNYIASNTKDTAGVNIKVDSLKSVNYKGAPWFEAAASGKWTSDKSKGLEGTYFEDMQVDPVYEFAYAQKRVGTSFTAAIKNEQGQIVGYITNRANNKWIESAIQNVYINLKEDGFDDAEVNLLNKDGFVISQLSPKESGGKIEFSHDLEKTLFKINMFTLHKPAGEHMAKHEFSSIKSQDGIDGGWDLVGYKFINEDTFVSSIGWTNMVHVDYNKAFASMYSAKNDFYLLSSIFAVLSLALAIWFSLSISRAISLITEDLTSNSGELSQASVQIASQSTELSESATQQAAALQETVAAVDEISAMVEKNAEAAEKSKQVSSQSREAATQGRETVESMIQAINDISSANDEISDQMSHSNRQLSEIAKLITDIGNKTKVINEIVFQTKLLSFNASVEAARAGEYGKGFAVVAEEVGNLAQMSGNAAKEITDMLDQSVHQVQNIISETQQKVDRLMENSKSKVHVGSNTAKSCNEALEEILTNVSAVDTLVTEITVASQEQSAGIREISKAIGQMEQVTQHNSNAAQASSTSAEQLRAQATALKQIVSSLAQVIQGAGNTELESVSEQMTPQRKNNRSILPFKKKETASKATSNFEHRAAVETPVKKVSGGDFSPPSSDDPGFAE